MVLAVKLWSQIVFEVVLVDVLDYFLVLVEDLALDREQFVLVQEHFDEPIF